MKPPAQGLLLAMAARLGALAGQPADAFSAFEQQIMALTAVSLMAEVERGAATRAADIEAFERLVARGADVEAPIEPLPAAPLDDLSLGGLDARLARASACLVELHAWLETSEHPAAAALLEEVWRELAASNRRRQGL